MINQVYDELRIPVELCFYCVKKRFYGGMELFIFLKMNCNGKTRIGNLEIIEIANVFGVHPKTIQNRLKKLILKKWIGLDRNNVYHINSFAKLMRLLEAESRTTVYFVSGYIKCFREFICGAVISHLAKLTKHKKRGNELKRIESLLPTKWSKEYSPVSTNGIAKCLGISLSTAHNLKKYAKKGGFIKIKSQFKLIEKNHEMYGNISAHHEHPERLYKTKNGIFERGIDAVKTNLVFKLSKNL